MQCSKCGNEITSPQCSACGFSLKENIRFLNAISENDYSFDIEIHLGQNPTSSELWTVAQQGEQGNPEACLALADYYYNAVKDSRLLNIWKDPIDYSVSKQVSTPIARAAYWVKKLLLAKGKLSPGHKYLLALELMQSRITGEEGLRYLKEAADAGYVRAIKLLIRCLEKGYYCDRDSATASIWKSRLIRTRAETLKLEFIDMVRDAWNGY